MPLFRLILVAALMFLAPLGLAAADPAAQPALTTADPTHPAATAPAKEEHHGLPLYATPVFNLGPLMVTNSMLVSWVVAILLIVWARVAMRNPKLIPTGAQNF